MSGATTVDTARLPTMLTQLRLPTVGRLWQTLTETADRESWPAARTLAALLEHEIAERAQRRKALQRSLFRPRSRALRWAPIFVPQPGPWNVGAKRRLHESGRRHRITPVWPSE